MNEYSCTRGREKGGGSLPLLYLSPLYFTASTGSNYRNDDIYLVSHFLGLVVLYLQIDSGTVHVYVQKSISLSLLPIKVCRYCKVCNCACPQLIHINRILFSKHYRLFYFIFSTTIFMVRFVRVACANKLGKIAISSISNPISATLLFNRRFSYSVYT